MITRQSGGRIAGKRWQQDVVRRSELRVVGKSVSSRIRRVKGQIEPGRRCRLNVWTTLERGDPGELPAVGQSAHERVVAMEARTQVDLVVSVDHVRAVGVQNSVVIVKVQR